MPYQLIVHKDGMFWTLSKALIWLAKFMGVKIVHHLNFAGQKGTRYHDKMEKFFPSQGGVDTYELTSGEQRVTKDLGVDTKGL